MASQRMIASNRKNARKSRGPKTVEGKNIVRRNALKHGLTARTLVVLGECEADFQAMADQHFAVLQPRNAVELEFCKTFTLAAWRRQRCVSAEAGITNEHIRATQLDEETTARNAALAMGERLFHRLGVWQSYLNPLAKYRPNYRDHFGPPDPMDAAAQLVADLESTLEGCRFLLEHWRDLKMRLNCEGGWKPFEMFMCIRLTGRELLDVLDEPPGELMDIFLACRKIDGSDRVPFKELRLCVGHDIEFEIIFERLQGMGYEARTPVSVDHARSILDNLVDRHTGRLEDLFRAHQERFLVEAAERARRLIFHAGDGAEKARRYGDICVRQMTRACEELIKVRCSGFGDEDGGSEHFAESEPEEPDSIPAEVGLTAPSVRRGSPDHAVRRTEGLRTGPGTGDLRDLGSAEWQGQSADGGLPQQVATYPGDYSQPIGRKETSPLASPVRPGLPRVTPPGPPLSSIGGRPVRDTPPDPPLSRGRTLNKSGVSAQVFDSRLFGYALLLLVALWRSLLGAVAARMRVGERPLLTAETAVLRLVQALSIRLAVAQNKPVAICAGRAGASRRLMMASPP
jgi:hypothetical protein